MLQKLLAILLAVSLLAGCTAAPVETTGADTRQHVYELEDFCYHIPAVDLPGINAREMNQKLYDTYETLLQEVVFGKPREELFLLGLLIAENGELQFVGEFYSLAGADSYMYRFNQKGELIQMTCPEHS